MCDLNRELVSISVNIYKARLERYLLYGEFTINVNLSLYDPHVNQCVGSLFITRSPTLPKRHFQQFPMKYNQIQQLDAYKDSPKQPNKLPTIPRKQVGISHLVCVSFSGFRVFFRW